MIIGYDKDLDKILSVDNFFNSNWDCYPPWSHKITFWRTSTKTNLRSLSNLQITGIPPNKYPIISFEIAMPPCLNTTGSKTCQKSLKKWSKWAAVKDHTSKTWSKSKPNIVNTAGEIVRFAKLKDIRSKCWMNCEMSTKCCEICKRKTAKGTHKKI